MTETKHTTLNLKEVRFMLGYVSVHRPLVPRQGSMAAGQRGEKAAHIMVTRKQSQQGAIREDERYSSRPYAQ